MNQGGVDLLSTFGFWYIGFALEIHSDLPNLCTQETIKLEPFAIKLFRRRVRQGDVVANSNVEAAPGILVAPFLGDTFMSTAKCLTTLFEIEQEIMALAIVG